MKKIGTILNSRPCGREALLAIGPNLSKKKEDEELVVDFNGVKVLTPSFADEFLTPLITKHHAGGIKLIHTQENITVRKTIAFLKEDWSEEVVLE